MLKSSVWMTWSASITVLSPGLTKCSRTSVLVLSTPLPVSCTFSWSTLTMAAVTEASPARNSDSRARTCSR